MQLRVCCRFVSLLMAVAPVLAQYRNEHYRFSNFNNRWADWFGVSTSFVSHEVPRIEEMRNGWLGYYRYRPFFSRVSFDIPPLLPDEVHRRPPGEESHDDNHGNDGEIGFLDWRDEPFGPPKPVDFETKFPDSGDTSQEIAPGDNQTEIKVAHDFTPIKNDSNATVVTNLEDDEEDDSDEKEDDQDNSDKDVLLDDDDEKSKYPAASPDLVELIPSNGNHSGQVSDDVTQSKVPAGPFVPPPPTWNMSPFDYFSRERRPASIAHQNGGQFNEIPVIFANHQSTIDDFWNSAEELNSYPFSSSGDGFFESPVAPPQSSLIHPPAPTSTTPEPDYKFRGSSDRPKSVYKPNYRKVPIDQNKRL